MMLSFGLRARGVALALIGVAAFAASSACSFIYDSDDAQCETAADCQAKGPAFAGTVCGDNHICAINAQVSCTMNSQCQELSPTMICRKTDSKCIDLVSPDCPVENIKKEQDDLKNDDTLIIGSLMTLTGSLGPSTGVPAINAMEMARQDFRLSYGGIPNPKGGVRPLVIQVCDAGRVVGTSGTAQQSVIDAANHLVNDVKVPLILGTTQSGHLTDVAKQVAVPGNVMMFSALAQSSSVTTLPADSTIDPVGTRLIWRTAPADTILVKSYTGLVKDFFEKEFKKAGGIIPAGQPMKVMLIYKGDNYGNASADAQLKALTFNDTSASANESAGNYMARTYGNTTTADTPAAQEAFAKVVTDALAFKPHLIAIVGTTEADERVVIPIDNQWTESSYRPSYIYLGGAGTSLSLLASVQNKADKPGSLAKRLYVINPGLPPGERPLLDLFRSKYSTQTNGSKSNNFAEAAYDAVYSTIYAVTAAGDKPLTGPRIAASMAAINGFGTTGRAKVNVERDAINATLKTLQGGGTVDLDGISGPLDWDPKTGDTLVDINVYCMTQPAPADDATKPDGYGNTGVYWSAATQGAKGTVKTCFK